MSKKSTHTVKNVRLTTPLVEDIERFAAIEGRSFTNFIEYHMKEILEIKKLAEIAVEKYKAAQSRKSNK